LPSSSRGRSPQPTERPSRTPRWQDAAMGEPGGPGDPHGFAERGEHTVVTDPVLSIVNPGGIALGSWVHIGAHAVIEALVPERGVTVRIDDGAYLGNFLRVTAVHHVHIGREALVSDRVYISDTGHEYEDATVPIKHQGLRD